MKTPDDTPDNENGTWESEMGDEFERRVRDLHEAPLDLSSVKGKAMKIRNRRRAAVAGGVLAAAAVLVPVAVIATNGSTTRADGIDPADTPSAVITDPSTPAPSPAPTQMDDPVPPPSTPPAVEGALGFDYLEVGSAESIYHRADGTTAALPDTGYLAATDLGDRIAVLRSDDSEYGMAVDLVQDGQVTTTYDVRSEMAIAPDGGTVAFITTEDVLLFVRGGGTEQDGDETPFGEVAPDVTLSAIIGNGDCVLETGCHPFLEYQDFTQDDAFEINYEGDEHRPGARRAPRQRRRGRVPGLGADRVDRHRLVRWALRP